MTRLFSMLSVLLLCTGTVHAATLDGDTIDISYVGGFGPSFATQSVLVGPGNEFVIDFGSGRTGILDLAGDVIELTFQSGGGNAAFGTFGYEFQLSDLDFGTGIVGLNVEWFEDSSGVISNSVGVATSFTSDSVNIKLQDTWEVGDRATVTLEVIPLPASLPLLLAGVCGLLGLRRIRRLQVV